MDMIAKMFSAGSPYKSAKKQLKNFSDELKALGSKKYSNGDLIRYRDRYKRIVNSKTKKNISQKEAGKLELLIEEFRQRFKHLGFMDDMAPFMPDSIPELSCDKLPDISKKHEENERYNLRSKRNASDDEKRGKLLEDYYASGESNHNNEYCAVQARLESFILTTSNITSLSSDDVKKYKSTFKEIGNSMTEQDFSRRQHEELSHLYNEGLSGLRNLVDIASPKTGYNHDTRNELIITENIVTEGLSENETKQTVCYYGRWSQPNSKTVSSEARFVREIKNEDRQHKSADLPQIHSSAIKTEPNQSYGDSTPSSSASSFQNKSIEWEMLANERRSNQDLYKDDHRSTKSSTHKERETAANFIRRSVFNSNSDKSQKHDASTECNMSFSSGTDIRSDGSISERKTHEENRASTPESHSCDQKSKPSEDDKKEMLHSKDSIGTELAYDQKNHRRRYVSSSYMEHASSQEEKNYNQYSREGRGRGKNVNTQTQFPTDQSKKFSEHPRNNSQDGSINCSNTYTQSSVGQKREYFEQHPGNSRQQHGPRIYRNTHGGQSREFSEQHPEIYRQQYGYRNNGQTDRSSDRPTDVSGNRKKNVSNYESRSRTPTDRNLMIENRNYNQNQASRHYSDHYQTVIDIGDEVKEEKPLEILDVHQYFRDDFGLNSVDSLDNNIDKIDAIDLYAKTFENKVKSFDGDLLECFVLDEKLMRIIEKLDKIKCQDDRKATEKKVELIRYIKGLHVILDERAKDA